MLKEFKDYLEANHGKVIDFSIDEDGIFGIHFSSLLVSTVVIERIMDNYNWIEGLSHDINTDVYFDIEEEMVNAIASEILTEKLF